MTPTLHRTISGWPIDTSCYPGLVRFRNSCAPTQEEISMGVSVQKAASLAASLALVLAACASPGPAAPAGSGGAPGVPTAAPGATGTNDKNNGGGPKADPQ